MIYTVDWYIKNFFNSSKAAAERWGVHPQQIADWRNAGMLFIVEGDRHTRCSIRGEINYENTATDS